MSYFLETGRLGFRPWRPNEFDALAALLQDPEVMAHWPAPLTDDQVREWLEFSAEAWETQGFGRAAVIRRIDGAVIGDVGFYKTEIEGRPVTDLGYIFHTHAQGQGYATEAAFAFLGWGTDILRLDDIVVHMPDDHTASRRVAERLKMHLDRRFSNPENRGKTHLVYVDLWSTLHKLEIELMDPETRRDRERLSALLSDDVLEFGRSGGIDGKASVISYLVGSEQNYLPPLIVSYAVRTLSEDRALATFRTVSEGRTALRSSVWRKIDGNWKLDFHQGTPVP